MAEIAVVMVFIFGCTLLAEFQCGLDLCMMDGYNFSRIMLTFFTATSPLRTPAPLRKHNYVGDNGTTLCLIVIPISICFKAFQYIRIILSTKYCLLPKTFVVLMFTTPRKASELKFLHCKERMDIHTILYSFYGAFSIHFTGRKNC